MASTTSSMREAERARAFAIAAHGEQKYGDQPYVVHLAAVAEFCRSYGEVAQTIAYLHDVVEDTAVSLDRVREEFGEHVAQCVALVTDSPGANRAERKLHTNAKLAKVTGELQTALIVKAADRLANLRMSARSGGEAKLAMYRAEHEAFRDAAFRAGLCDELWSEMTQVLALRDNVPTITRERPDSADAVALITELESILEPLYPSKSRHGFSVEKLIAENVAFFVLRDDGKPAGCGGIKLFGAEYGELKRMFVRPEFRGRGFAKLMLDHLENYAREQNVPLVRLETGIHQLEAIGLYERSGYRLIGPFGSYGEDPFSRFYEKRIG
ncbi:MAG TPA: GNAT family N-acetyltransferase [Tepidisphaeraceae bacterium]|nr:GNAT family N-acetyltransferase [Tepidisphaeraceae bacterium]